MTLINGELIVIIMEQAKYEDKRIVSYGSGFDDEINMVVLSQ